MEINLDEELELGEIELDIIEVYPELENIEITPTIEEQNLKSDKYGFDEIKVHGIPAKELNITPSTEDQVNEGLFNKVIVEKISGDNLEIIPSLEEQNFNGVYTDIKVNSIRKNEVTITPTSEEQVQEGIITKVTVEGSVDLQPQNIVKDKEIFGVQGTYDGIDTSDATGQASDVLLGKTVYARGVKLEGTYKESSDYNAKLEPSTATFTISSGLKEISSIVMSGVTSMANAFKSCNRLIKISQLDTSNVTNMSSMFDNCRRLEIIPELNTSNVTVMSKMFYYCEKIVEIPQLDTSNVTAMNMMFDNCVSLRSVPKLNAIKCTSLGSIFGSCSSLENLGGLENLGKAFTQKTANYGNYTIDLITCTSLTHDSLMNVINNLYDLNLTYNVANGGTLYTQKLTLGATNLAKLTAEEIRNCYC